MRWMVIVAALLGIVVAGCGGHAAGRSEGASRDRIGVDEISQASAQNSYEMIRSLRPHWLRVSNPAALPVVVYVDGTRAGGVEVLRQLPAPYVESAQYLNGSAAAARYGLNHSGGAILILTRRR